MTFAFKSLVNSARRSSRRICAALGVVALLISCGETVEVGFNNELVSGGSAAGGSGGGGSGGLGGLDIGGSSAAAGAAGVPATGGEPGCTKIYCRGKPYACGDCSDNDNDGRVDADDPDCLGPCDNDEAGLSTGVISSDAACRVDCYFDGDAGPGNDKCNWSHACDPLSPSSKPGCSYDPNATSMGVSCTTLNQTQDQQCLDACLPLVPNGCDCFGCCLLPDQKYHYVGHGPAEQGCQLGHEDDLVACPLCTHVESCYNDCQPCETCVGKLPDASCAPSGGCKAGQRACNSDTPCDFGDYCVTGCCVRAPPPT